MTSADRQLASDPLQLLRFVDAQAKGATYEMALAELRVGKKSTHWMWFVFPQYAGLGKSPTAQFYAIKTVDEAKAYLAHPILGRRLRECCEAIMAIEGKSAFAIFDSPDDLKLKSSMTLFAQLAGSVSVFTRVLDKYFDGQSDQRTLDLLSPTISQ